MPAKRGRPAKPSAIKKLHNAGRRPLNDAEPEGPLLGAGKPEETNVVPFGAKADNGEAAAGAIAKDRRGKVVAVAAPAHVTGIALKKWNELAPSLATARVLREWDLDALARYCNAFKTEVQAQQKLEEMQANGVLNGLLSKTPNGMIIMNALLGVRNAAMRDAHRFGAVLGLDPVSRSSIKADRPEDDEGWGEFAS